MSELSERKPFLSGVFFARATILTLGGMLLMPLLKAQSERLGSAIDVMELNNIADMAKPSLTSLKPETEEPVEPRRPPRHSYGSRLGETDLVGPIEVERPVLFVGPEEPAPGWVRSPSCDHPKKTTKKK